MHQIRFAIIDPNILTGIGLQNILENIMPNVEITLVQSFDEMKKEDADQFVHFFVSSRIYFEHAQYFREQHARSIVLVSGDMNISGVKTINVCQSEKNVVRDILSLRNNQHGAQHSQAETDRIPARSLQHSVQPLLSSREVEVAVLLSKGFINKEVADRLDISLTTVISHRKNIMEKLHARSLADIIIYAVMNGLVDASEL